MKVISIGSDRKLFEENSAVRQRQIEYGKFFEEVHIVVFNKRDTKHELRVTKIADNIFVYPTNSRSKLFYIFNSLLIIKKLIKNFKLKIENCVITAQDPFETGLIGAIAKLFFGLPLHIQIHTDFMAKYFTRVYRLNRIRIMIAEFVLKYSDRVRVVSERVKRSIEKFSKNIDVLPIIVKKSEIRNPKSETEKSKTKNILTVCRLEKEKNIETAIKTFKIVSERFPEMTFTIVGDGGERKNLEKLSEILNLKSKIYFVGWQSDLNKYYEEADIYISTSLYEGYGMSMVEAASCGLPLILSDTGLVGDVFENNESAMVCDAKDTDCFAQNIIKIYENENLARKIGESAKTAASNHFKPHENYFEKYADSIKKTADNFKKRNFMSRAFNFKIMVWNSFITLRYFFCGITATAVNLITLYLFTDIAGIWYLYSSTLAFLVSLIVSFTLQKFVVFRDMKVGKMHRQFSRFSIAAVLGTITNTALMFVCVDVLGIWYIFSQIIAGFFVMIQNFILYKFFIFNRK